MRSAIKQVASGRFGVTAEYLVNSDMMQIKMAQGAKPGEGGQLPGHKVDKTIAKVRHSTPGVGLISPPPHHDIYSIEDLAQLIFDLKNVNPAGDVSVKLVSEVGVGTVAAGVSKARADHVTISGFEGGTGASPLTSIKHAGSPVGNRPRRDAPDAGRSTACAAASPCRSTAASAPAATSSIGALLGADEFGFATAPLIAAGCIMMRKCHLNTCPVGVATQDPVLRKRFKGQPEHVINYFFFVAEEVRELMAELGYRTLRRDGRPDADARPARSWSSTGRPRASTSPSCSPSRRPAKASPSIKCEPQDHKIERRPRPQADRASRRPRSTAARRCDCRPTIRNTDRAAGAMLSGEVAKRYGHAGLPDDTIHVQLHRHRRPELRRLARARHHLRARRRRQRLCRQGPVGRPHHHPAAGRLPASCRRKSIIVGNTVLYGAIEGECYFRGVAGERFAVRNSGAIAVVEGAGDHCCEYMTGGVVVVLGTTGRNFAAGMSGGIAYVLDEDGTLRDALQHGDGRARAGAGGRADRRDGIRPRQRPRIARPRRRDERHDRRRRRAAAPADLQPRALYRTRKRAAEILADWSAICPSSRR